MTERRIAPGGVRGSLVMVKSAPAQAIDAILADTLGPDLKVAGFRRSRRHWNLRTDEVCRAVSVQTSKPALPAAARFTIELGVAFLALGDDVPATPDAGAFPLHERIGGLRDDCGDKWYVIDDVTDAGQRDRVRLEVAQDWRTLGRPLLDAMETPSSLCMFAADSNVRVALHVLGVVGVRLPPDLQRELLASATADVNRRWRIADTEETSAERCLPYYAAIAQHLGRLGLRLEHEDRDAARQVLADVESNMLTTPYHGEVQVRQARGLAEHLGVALDYSGRVDQLEALRARIVELSLMHDIDAIDALTRDMPPHELWDVLHPLLIAEKAEVRTAAERVLAR